MRYIYKGIRTLLDRKLEVPVLDATAIGVSILRRDFNTAGSVMFLLGIGEIIEDWTHKKSVDDLARTMSLNVNKVWLKTDDAEVQVSVKDVKDGDNVIIRMGNVIPFDGTVISGEAMVNQASLTGESEPVRRGEGTSVFAGTVVDMGSDVKEFEVGEMVGIGYDNCGECEFCKKGLTSECVTLGAGRNKLSPDGYHGGFGCSEYVIKPYRSLFKLNQTMDPSEAAFVEPVGTVCQGIRKLRVQQGEKIVVIGAGTMGVLNALVAKAEGCEVMITEMMDKKIEVAKELGLNVVDVKEKDPVEAVKEWTDGRGVDAVILAVGVTAANDQALEMIKRLHGRILMFAAGYPAPELHVDSNLIHYRKMELIGTFSADKCDFERAAELMREKKIDLSKLVEAKYKLDDVEQAFEAAIVPGAYRVSVVFD